MDNPNDPNSTNNPNYSPPSGPSPSSGPPNQPFPNVGNIPEPPPTQPEPTPPPLTNSDPSPSWPPPSDPNPPMAQAPSSPPPTWPATPVPEGENQNQPATWTPPDQSMPQPEPISATPEPTPPSSGAEPTPTFTPPPPATAPSETQSANQPAEAAGSEPALSPLDNPWGAPVKPPPIEQPQAATQPSWTNIPTNPTDEQTTNAPPAAPAEATPTDLSHLISNNNQPEQAAQPASETLVIPSTATPAPEIPTLPTQNHKGIPKWLIGLGLGLLLLVGGASAYFILGVGQPTKTTSLPATTTPETSEVQLPPPITTPTEQAQSSEQTAATGSANFGELQDSGSQGATSAADLLRQRQGR